MKRRMLNGARRVGDRLPLQDSTHKRKWKFVQVQLLPYNNSELLLLQPATTWKPVPPLLNLAISKVHHIRFNHK
jgi:hypothetical protein